MTHRYRLRLACAAAALALGAPAAAARAQSPETALQGADIPVIASDTLRDVAMTVLRDGHPVILYNPRLMERVGPRLRDFFLAHERGHVVAGHTGGALVHLASEQRDEYRQRLELEADCGAARALGATRPDVIDAAVHFFMRMGPYRFDRLHPTGAQRAAKILACAPEVPAPAERAPRAPSPLATTGDIVLEAPHRSATELGCDAEVWLDGRLVGTVSNLRQPVARPVRALAVGPHHYRVRLRIFALDQYMQLNPSGEVEGEGTLDVRPGDRVEVTWEAGRSPALRSRPAEPDAAPAAHD